MLNDLSWYPESRYSKRWALFFFTSVSLFFSLSFAQANDLSAADEPEPYNWASSNVAIANKHIVPRYRSLAKSTKKLSESVERICVSGKSTIINGRVDKDFKRVYLDWAAIQHIKFGPVSFLQRQERFQYWPDKHNSSERQLRKLLQSFEQNSELSLRDFQKKSVALQGLTALERMLYSSDTLISTQECQLAELVSMNLAQIADELDQNWRLAPVEYANEFALADTGSGTYESSDEVINILADSLVTQLLLISEYKLARGLPKKEGGRVYPRRLEAWRTELSLDLTKQSISSLYSLFKTAYRVQLKKVDAELYKQINDQFKKVLSRIKKSPKSMSVMLTTEQGVEHITALKEEVKVLELLVRNDMFAQLGFAKRFNSLDGD